MVMINPSDNKMLRRLYLWCIPLLIIPIIFCSATYQILIHKCIWWQCAPTRDFTIYDLNLPDHFFPSNAQVSPLHPDRQEVSVDEAATTNYWENGRAVYSVLRFSTIKKAERWFDFEVNSFEFTKELDDITAYKRVLEYRSKVADEHAVFCGYVSSDIQCDFGARYQEFYVFFSGSMGSGEMSVDDFLGVMDFVDTKMQELLYSSSP